MCPGAFRPATTLDAIIEMEFSALGRDPTSDEKAALVRAMQPAVASCGAACDWQRVADQYEALYRLIKS